MEAREAAWPGGVPSPDLSCLVEAKAAREGITVREARIGMARDAVLFSMEAGPPDGEGEQAE